MLKSFWLLAGKWKWRLIFALTDQGLLSLSNFILTIILANKLTIEAFGNYSIVWTITLFVENIGASLINEPLPAIVSKHTASDRASILRAASFISLSLALGLSLLILGSGFVVEIRSHELGVLLLYLAVVSPVQRLQLFVRRLCYLEDRQGVAALAALISASTLLGGLAMLIGLDELSARATLMLWGAAGASTIIVGLLTGVLSTVPPTAAAVLSLARNLWDSGRWLLATSVVAWFGWQGIIPLLAIYAGAGAAGVLRAIMNLFTPVTQANAAINLALLPRFADIAAESGLHRLRVSSLYGTALFFCVASAYSAVFFFFPQRAVSLIYNNQEIVAANWLLWPIGLTTIIKSLGQGFFVTLLAVARTQTLFLFRMAGFATFVTGALIFTPGFGIVGFVWSMAASTAVVTVLLSTAVLTRRR